MVRENRISRFALAILIFAAVGVVAKGEGHDSGTTAMHRKLDCSHCHQVIASIGSMQPAPSPINQCRTCHTASSLVTSDLGRTFHSDNARSCAECHSFHETSRISAAGKEFNLSPASGKGLCSGCHAATGTLTNLSPGHLLAAKIFHSNAEEIRGLSASQACMICHSENRSVQIDGNSSIEAPRFSERHTHPVGEISHTYVGSQGTRLRSPIDSRLHVFGNRIECATCHNLASTTRHRLAGFENPQDLCAGCHVVD